MKQHVSQVCKVDTSVSHIQYVYTAETARDAFSKMKSERVQVLPIIDSISHKLVDAISVSDLKLWSEVDAGGGLAFQFLNLGTLDEPVLDFVAKTRQKQNNKHESHLVTCLLKDTIESVVQRMMFHNVHSAFIVNDIYSVVGLFTYTDVIQALFVHQEDGEEHEHTQASATNKSNSSSTIKKNSSSISIHTSEKK